MHTRRRPRVTGEAGFSLLELVIVVAMAAAVLLVFVQGVRQGSASFQVRKAANIAIAEMRTAQAVSMANGVDMAVEFYTSTGSGTPGGVRTWARQPGTGLWFQARSALPPEFPNNVQMPEGVTNFPNCPAAIHLTHDCAIFKPLGYAEDDGRIRLRAIGASGIQLDLVMDQPATGRVVVVRP
jgi:type II secretory pathway pseudopilin PulG